MATTAIQPPVIEESDIGAIIGHEISLSQSNEDTIVTAKRARALEYLRGYMPDLPHMPGTSSLISSDFQDTLGWILPSVVRVFDSTDNMAEYQPERQSDEEAARQATDYVNYLFKRENDGYRIIFNTTWDSLAMGNGLVRVYWDDAVQTETETLHRLTAMQIAMLEQDGDVEVLAVEANPEPDVIPVPDEQTGELVPTPVTTFNVKVERTLSRGRLCFDTLKPENLVLPNVSVQIEGSRSVGYLHDDKTRYELVEMGFDKDLVWSLPRYAGEEKNEIGQARDYDRVTDEESPIKSGDIIDLYEFYIHADVDGDGRAELLQVWYAGGAGTGKVLEWGVWEEPIPFVDFPCYPQPHRFDAQGVFDKTADIMRAKTVLLRQGTNNLYASNLPMREVEEGSVLNPDILVNPLFGGTVWKKRGSAPTVPHAVPFVADKAFTAMSYFDNALAKRTGITAQTMALDPEALQNQSATANQNAHDAAYTQIEIIARNHAQYGWAKVFEKALKLVVKHQDRPRVVRLRDKWVEMDPRTWNANMDAMVNVGLGTGSKDRDMSMLSGILNQQIGMADRLSVVKGAETKALEFIPKIVDTAVKIAESSGLKDPESYFPSFDDEDLARIAQAQAQASEQPNPEVLIQQEKAKADAQAQQAKLQLQAQNDQAQNILKQEQIASDAQLKREEMAINAQIKREQLAGELELKRAQLTAELALRREIAMMGLVTDTNASTSGVQLGGEPG